MLCGGRREYRHASLRKPERSCTCTAYHDSDSLRSRRGEAVTLLKDWFEVRVVLLVLAQLLCEALDDD